MENPGKGVSVAALVCGILGIIFDFLFVWVGLILSILGIVFGVKGRKQSPVGMTGMATGGLVCGIIGTVFGALFGICALCALAGVASLGAL